MVPLRVCSPEHRDPELTRAHDLGVVGPDPVPHREHHRVGRAPYRDVALRVLQRFPRYRTVVPHLSESLDEFWSIVEPLPSTMLQATREQEIAFLDGLVVLDRDLDDRAVNTWRDADDVRPHLCIARPRRDAVVVV